MLIDDNGREVRADSLPRNRKAREAVLATLREIPVPHKDKSGMFRLGLRATLREKL